MSTRPLQAALTDAESFRALFPAQAYARWEIAGSVRRRKPMVKDIEHIVVAAYGSVPDGLFGEKRVNLLWYHLDTLVKAAAVQKHLYESHRQDGTTSLSPRWGDLYRGVEYLGWTHEIFLATEENWGAQLVIRTGPADFSKRVVTALLDGGMYRQQGGALIHVQSGEAVPVPSEHAYFKLAGMRYVEPELRQ